MDSTRTGEASSAYQLHPVEQRGLGCIEYHISEPLLSGPALRLQDSTAERAAIEGHLRAREATRRQSESAAGALHELDYGHAGQPPGQHPCWPGAFGAALKKLQNRAGEYRLSDHGDPSAVQGSEAADVRECCSPSKVMGAGAGAGAARRWQLSWPAQPGGVRAKWRIPARPDAGSGILDKDWLQQLLNHGQRPEVGAVGAKLLAADGRVRHAGEGRPVRTWPGGPSKGRRLHEDAGHRQRLVEVDHELLAVAGECLLMRRELFLELPVSTRR